MLSFKVNFAVADSPTLILYVLLLIKHIKSFLINNNTISSCDNICEKDMLKMKLTVNT